jgi:septal ring-binding cell division protein DamX
MVTPALQTAPPATPPAAPAALATPKPGPAAGGFGAWLISMDNEAAAQGFLRVSQAKNPDFFAEVPAAVVPVRLGGGRTFYRVVAGGLPDRAAAAAVCRKLRESQPNAFCKVVAN